jgi:hypothetical protein
MAAIPCQICGQRYRGKQNSLYPALLSGVLQIREHIRMCPSCCESALTLLSRMQDSTIAVGSSPPCSLCTRDVPTLALFVTAYVEGAEREDYYARVCSRCAIAHVAPTVYGDGEALRPLDTALLLVETTPGPT